MRRAYIGLSSPIAYDYSNTFRVGIGEEVNFVVKEPFWANYNSRPYPTPILESPYGIMLFYDELWFLSRSLCPPDMQRLPYVNFILETKHSESVYGKYVEYDAPGLRESIISNYLQFAIPWTSVAQSAHDTLPIHWPAQLSDQSEIFMVSSMPCFGLAGKIETVLIDLVFLSHLDISGLELVTNRFSSEMLEKLTLETGEHSNLSTAIEPILLDGIPNYLTQLGCYHPSVEDARGDELLSDFRRWLSAHPKSVSKEEIAEITREVKERLKRLQNEVLLKRLSRTHCYLSTGKGLLGAGVDLLLPGVGTGLGALDTLLEGRRVEEVRWLGFIASQWLRAHKQIQPTQ